MKPQEPSRTSMIAAVGRGLHRERHAHPWLLDDPYALPFVGPGWRALYDALASMFSEQLQEEAIAAVVVRSRYAEDRLLGGGFAQYVVLGAGLDSFAWRRPDVLASTRVFEVDHPATQAWKVQRADELALPRNDGHVFAAVDFETQTLGGGLAAAGFDPGLPTFFSWLGVVAYLTPDAIEGTLRFVSSCAAGSEVVFSYPLQESLLDDTGREFLTKMSAIAADNGEPIQDLRSPTAAEEMVRACGLEVADHVDAAEQGVRYFADRGDGLRPYTMEAFIAATTTTTATP